MPTVLRVDGFRFFFYSNESAEPAHIHVERADCHAKFWINPIALAASSGFHHAELNEAQRIVIGHRKYFQERWNEFFGHQD